MAHKGPKPAPTLASAPMLLTGQAHPKPRDDRGHQKEKQSHTPALPSCGSVWQCAERPPGHAGLPHSKPATHGHSKKSLESQAEKMLDTSTGSITTPQWPHGWGAGVRKGRGMGRRQQITSETQRVFLPKGLNAVWWVLVSAEIYRTLHARNTSRPCSWHVACN